MKKRGALQIPFAWLFAIIVGAIILAIAIFAVTKIFDTGEAQVDARIGKEIGILLNPLETGFESLIASSFIVPVETRIYSKCNQKGYFGRQIIQASQKSFNKWTETNIDVGFSNKYVFSEVPAEGRKFYVFSMPFEFPFKIADLIYLTSSETDYCFEEAPGEILDDLEAINQNNFLFEDCDEDFKGVKVCFSDAVDCDMEVDVIRGFVQKGADKLYFAGDSLMYAAIFSEAEVYECHLKRLMQRVVSLSEIYKDKAELVARVGCSSELSGDLTNLINQASGLVESGSSANLAGITTTAESIEIKNELMRCKLW